jgi:3-methyladenine DNA glycosylase AlkD
MTTPEILAFLEAHANEANRTGMARYGINVERAYGVPVAVLRPLAKEIGRNHALALELWPTGVHEARILACLIADPALTTPEMMDTWVKDIDSWDLCDMACNNLFRKTPHAHAKIPLWAASDHDFTKRAAFSLLATLAVHDKGATDETFRDYLKLVQTHAVDTRNPVKKAVNWSLRGIGKRNRTLHKAALSLAQDLLENGSQEARWVARDAIRELTNEKIVKRIPELTRK